MTEPIEEKEFDVVMDALQERYDILWKMTKSNMESQFAGMSIMDDIRLKQMEQLEQAIKLRKQHHENR